MHPTASDAERFEQIGRAAWFGRRQRKQHVLGLDPGIAQVLGLHERALEHALALIVERQRALARPRRPADGEASSSPRTASSVTPRPSSTLAPDTVLLGDHPEQQMLGTDESVAQSSRRVARLNDDLARTIGEQLKHPARIASPPSTPRAAGPRREASSSHAGPRRVAVAQCRRPVGRTASRSTTVSLPLARGLGSASGRRPAFRATSTTGSPQGGNQR